MAMKEPGGSPTADRDATIYDVARRAGVAASTVSRTFTRPDRVSFKTAEKIRAVARELGYGTQLATRGADPLGRRRSNLIGMISADIQNPYFLELLRGAEQAAFSQQMVVTVADASESLPRSQQAIERLTPHVDGLLLASARLSPGEIQKVARFLPTVVLGQPVPGVPSVMVDNYQGTLKAVVHLEAQGCRSITYLAGPEHSWADATRWRGLIEAVGHSQTTAPLATHTRAPALSAEESRQLSRISAQQLKLDEPTIRGGRRAFEAWWRRPTDAVLCFNDLAAIGFMQQAQLKGVRVPADVAVIGFDNTELTTLFSPSLTTVAGPLSTVGQVATTNLMALVNGSRTPMVKPRVLPTRLIVRESTTRQLR